MLISLLMGAALAGAPDAVRADGDLVFGCSSLPALEASSGGFPAGVGESLSGGLEALRTFGGDPNRPVWTVMSQRNGRLLPTQFVFHVPDGVKPPTALLRMMPGSPRVQQNGTEVNVLMGGPPGDASTPMLGMAARALGEEDGCVLAASTEAMSGLAPGLPISLALGVRPDGTNTAVFSVPEEGVPDLALGPDSTLPPGLTQALVQLVRTPAEPPRKAWASTVVPPKVALRANNEIPIEPLLGLMFDKPEDIPAFAKKVVVEPGLEFVQPPSTAKPAPWGLVAPIKKPRTVCWWPGRIAASARKQGQTVEKHGRVFGVHGEGEGAQTLWFTAKRRRFIVGTSREVVTELRDPKSGTPVFGEAEADQPGTLLIAPLQGNPVKGRIYPDSQWIVVDYALQDQTGD